MDTGSATSGQPPSAPAVAGLAMLPLFLAAWLFAAGILISHALWVPPGHLFIALAALGGLCALAAFRALRVSWLPMGFLWLLLGTWAAELQPQPAPAAQLLTLSNGLLRTVEGTVLSASPVRSELEQNLDEPTTDLPSQRVDLGLSSIEIVTDTDDRQVPVTGAVRLAIRWPGGSPTRIQCGERIRAIARLLPPAVYHDPGAWSRADYLLDFGVTSTATVNIERIERLTDENSPALNFARLGCRLSEMQQNASSRLLALPALMRRFPAALRLSPDDAVMLSATVTGDRTFLAHSLRVGFERTGSFHMLVVSGLHLGILAVCIAWVARRLRIPRFPATLLTIAASFVYALFTGFATPVQRSFWMISLYLIARLIYRDRNVLNTIGFAALCLLVASPRDLFNASFQMTLLAVVAIGGIAMPLLTSTIHPYLSATRSLGTLALDIKLPPHIAQFRVTVRLVAAHLQRATGTRVAWRILPSTIRFSLRIVEALVVSIVVELAMALPMAVWFHRFTLFALPVNLFILPLLFLLMPAALFTLLVLLVWPTVATVPAALVALLLHMGIGLVHGFGSLAWGDIRLATPLPWQTAVFCGLLAAALMLAHAHLGRLRELTWAALVAAALVAVFPNPIRSPRNALLFEAIDVGQGDSILLITPEGKTLLVDGGGFGGGPRQSAQEFDIGEEVVSAALWSRGIRHLDAVALSHAHSDHMGGLPAVLRNFHPDELWVGDNPHVAPYDALLDEASQLHTRLRTLRSGDEFMLGSVRIRALAPFPSHHPGAEPSNNDSMVLHVAYGDTSVLLEGDAEAPIEESMLNEPGLASTLLKVGHHGSTTSTRPGFLARVAPRWAVISCGLRNRYGHPRQEILRELQSAHVRTFSTDVDGAVCMRLDGASVQPEPCAPSSGP